jgi:hypothetical protein
MLKNVLFWRGATKTIPKIIVEEQKDTQIQQFKWNLRAY